MTEFRTSPEPKSSPYGAIQTAKQIAPGLWSVSTASHGGIQVYPQRQGAMPEHLRLSRTWFEEDCEWALVALAFPNDFSPAQVADAILTVCNAYPEAYEAHVGVALVAGQSRARDQAMFKAAHVGDYVVRSAFGDWAPWVPQGSVGVYLGRLQPCQRRSPSPAAANGVTRLGSAGETAYAAWRIVKA